MDDKIKSGLETLSIITISTIIVLFYFFGPLSVSIALTLLVGVWFIDVFLKYRFEIDIQTIFADLSFASLILIGGQIIEILQPQSLSGSKVTNVQDIVVFTVVLAIIWLGNLSACSYLSKPNFPGYIAMTISIMLSLFSIGLALMPYYLGLI